MGMMGTSHALSALLICSTRLGPLGRALSYASSSPAKKTEQAPNRLVEDQLFDKIPRPDVLLSQHVVKTKAGTVQIRSGAALSACDCFALFMTKATLRGCSSHRRLFRQTISRPSSTTRRLLRLWKASSSNILSGAFRKWEEIQEAMISLFLLSQGGFHVCTGTLAGWTESFGMRRRREAH